MNCHSLSVAGYVRGRCACRKFGISSCDATSFDRITAHLNWRVAGERIDKPRPERRAAFRGTLLLALMAIVGNQCDALSRVLDVLHAVSSTDPATPAEESSTAPRSLVM